MAELFIFIYAMTAMFVLRSLRRNQRAQRANPQMVVLVGWGLFSFSSTLAVLMGAVALALALGMQVQLPAGFATPGL